MNSAAAEELGSLYTPNRVLMQNKHVYQSPGLHDSFEQNDFLMEENSQQNAATNSVIKSSINYAIGACY
jgi:hypothetical protein